MALFIESLDHFLSLLSDVVKYFDESGTQLFVVRCKMDSFRQVWAAMTLISSLGGSGGSSGTSSNMVSISVLHVSGEGTKKEHKHDMLLQTGRKVGVTLGFLPTSFTSLCTSKISTTVIATFQLLSS